MSEHSQSEAYEPPGQGAAPAHPVKARNTVRIVLFAVLGVLLVAIAYDYLYARRAVEKAHALITNLSDQVAASAGSKVLTNQDIQQALGRRPSEVMADGPYTVEVYRWRAGLPWRTYDYYVVYSGRDSLLFTTHFMNEFVKSDTLAPPVERIEGGDVIPGGSTPAPDAGDAPDAGGAPDAGDAPDVGGATRRPPAEGDAPAEASPAEGTGQDPPAANGPADGQSD